MTRDLLIILVPSTQTLQVTTRTIGSTLKKICSHQGEFIRLEWFLERVKTDADNRNVLVFVTQECADCAVRTDSA